MGRDTCCQNSATSPHPCTLPSEPAKKLKHLCCCKALANTTTMTRGTETFCGVQIGLSRSPPPPKPHSPYAFFVQLIWHHQRLCRGLQHCHQQHVSASYIIAITLLLQHKDAMILNRQGLHPPPISALRRTTNHASCSLVRPLPFAFFFLAHQDIDDIGGLS